MGFSSIPVVNMAGRIIGLIPANFIITLIEHHHWYAEEKIRGVSENGDQVSNYYTSAVKRIQSIRLSQGDVEMDIDSEDGSPRGSIKGKDENEKFNLSADKKSKKVADALDNSLNKGSDESDPTKGRRTGADETDEVEFRYSEKGSNQHLALGEMPRDERTQTLVEFTGERDYEIAPKSEDILHWHEFCTDMYSSERSIHEVEDIANQFSHRHIDLRPYMIEQPYCVLTTDKLPKCLDLFRHMHLRALPVNDPNSGMPVAVLTRQDLFAYMAL